MTPFWTSTRPGQPFFFGSGDGAPGLSGQASTSSGTVSWSRSGFGQPSFVGSVSGWVPAGTCGHLSS